ncbi:hypothetical protein [Streptomyces sp. 2A115]|uniref:hypothetical protein n=1 Tax=Streptomyces sp. 2A115 TaxID=3457439 RepID=UPI003FD189BB
MAQQAQTQQRPSSTQQKRTSDLPEPLRFAGAALRKVPGSGTVSRAAEGALDKVGAVSPRGRRLAVYTGAGVLGVAGVVEWPIAVTGAAVAWLTQPRPEESQESQESGGSKESKGSAGSGRKTSSSGQRKAATGQGKTSTGRKKATPGRSKTSSSKGSSSKGSSSKSSQTKAAPSKASAGNGGGSAARRGRTTG